MGIDYEYLLRPSSFSSLFVQTARSYIALLTISNLAALELSPTPLDLRIMERISPQHRCDATTHSLQRDFSNPPNECRYQQIPLDLRSPFGSLSFLKDNFPRPSSTHKDSHITHPFRIFCWLFPAALSTRKLWGSRALPFSIPSRTPFYDLETAGCRPSASPPSQ